MERRQARAIKLNIADHVTGASGSSLREEDSLQQAMENQNGKLLVR